MRKAHLLGAAAAAALLFAAAPGMASDNGKLTADHLQLAQSSGTGADAGASSSAGGSTAGTDGGASTAGNAAGAGTTGSTAGGADANSAADSSAGATGGVTRPGSESTAETGAEAGVGVESNVGARDTTDLGTSTSDSMSTETGSPESAEIDTATGSNATTGAMTEPTMTTQSELTARYDEIVGMPVVNAEGESVGDIEDIVIDPSDNSAHAVVGVGGFLGLGEKQVTVPVDDLQLGEDEALLTSMGTSADLEARAAYEGDWKSVKE